MGLIISLETRTSMKKYTPLAKNFDGVPLYIYVHSNGTCMQLFDLLFDELSCHLQCFQPETKDKACRMPDRLYH
jgi:hypothetical protein